MVTIHDKENVTMHDNEKVSIHDEEKVAKVTWVNFVNELHEFQLQKTVTSEIRR